VFLNPAAPAGLSSIDSFQSAVGRRLDYDLRFGTIADGYPGPGLLDDAANARTPILSLDCSGFTNADIAAGLHDATIDTMAHAIAGYGHTVIIRYLWEMNSSISSNSRTLCAGPDDTNDTFNAPDFIAAWDHLRARFLADGATNTKWYWCPNDSAATLTPYYPGNSQVDYVGVDIYDRPPESFSQFATHTTLTYDAIENVGPGEPFVFGETGATSADQITFFTSLGSFYAKLPEVVGWVYYDDTGQLGNWTVEPGTAQFAALKKLVAP
jgi:hypothetical protein